MTEVAPFVLYRRVPRQMDWCETVLASYDEDRFRSMMGLLKSTFQKLADRLRESQSFRGPHQFPVDLQLAITLCRLRTSDGLAMIASIFGIGDGETVNRVTKRVFQAIADLQLIAWPTPNEKAQMIAESNNNLPYCLGIVDGTLSPLKFKPSLNGRFYSTYKKNYAVKWQIICDMNKKVRHLAGVAYGAVHDATVYKEIGPYKRPNWHFSGNEYIIGDSAYPLSPTCVTPYKSNSRAMTQVQRRSFNKKLSKYRVRVEHCIGEIKARFSSLKNIPLKIRRDADIDFCTAWVNAAAMVHNFAQDNDDSAMYECDVMDVEVAPPVLREENGEDVSRGGEQKRQWLYRQLIDRDD